MIKTTPRIKALGDWFSATGKPLYLVGGYVRNQLLGLPASDIDICAPVDIEQVLKLSNADFHVTKRAYGLGTVVVCQRWQGEVYDYEYTAFRKDSYGREGEHRPKHVTFTPHIKEDAARRDFTINALYMTTDGEVLDPLKRGRENLKNKKIAACTATTMQEDALRILRIVRFGAQLGFDIEDETYQQALQHVGQLASISNERIREELVKILLADVPYDREGAVLRGLHMLRDIGAWPYIIPELLEGDGFEQKNKYHAYDVMEHSLQSCAAACPDLRVRLAALLHDIRKPMVYEQDGNMYRHPEESAKTATKILTRLTFERAVVRDVAELISHHMFDLDNRAKKRAVNRMIVQMGREQFIRLCCLREADFEGSGRGTVPYSAQKWRKMLKELEETKAPFDKKELAIDGNDLMRELGIPEGRQVGDLLEKLHRLVLEKPKQNNYKNLIRYATMMYTKSPSNDRS